MTSLLIQKLYRASTGEESRKLPLFTSPVAAGFPVPGDDAIDTSLNLNDLLVDNPSSTFFVRVTGDSMRDVGILDGDVLVIDRSVRPVPGHIVVAAVYGELIVKRLKKVSDALVLASENPAYDPITVSDADDVYIWGVVTGSARRFT